MAADLAELKAMIEAALPGAAVEVIDEDGGGQHLRAVVTAPQFEGLSRIDQHRLVKAAVKERFDDGTIHALSVKTSVPELAATPRRQKVTILRATCATWIPSLRSMEAMRSTWTDARLDDFKDSVDSRLDELKPSDRSTERRGSTRFSTRSTLVGGGHRSRAFVAVPGSRSSA